MSMRHRTGWSHDARTRAESVLRATMRDRRTGGRGASGLVGSVAASGWRQGRQRRQGGRWWRNDRLGRGYGGVCRSGPAGP